MPKFITLYEKLLSAIKDNNTLSVINLIKGGAPVCKTDAKSRAPLHLAASLNSTQFIIDKLISAGARINAKDQSGNTPLHLAASEGRANMVRWLLNHGANPNITNSYGDMPLHRAIRKDHINVVQALLQSPILNKAHANKKNETPWQLASRKHSPALLRMLVEAGAPVSKANHTVNAQIAINPESSQLPETPDEIALLSNLRAEYRPQFENADTVLQNISVYLANQYHYSPALTDSNTALPLHHNPHLASQSRYFEHTLHTAWRLFQRPNPWISPEAKYGTFDANGHVIAAHLSRDDKETVACLWLAAQKEGCIDLFINELAYIARAHNWDTSQIDPATKSVVYFDDKLGDKPSCGSGIKKRLNQFLQLLPSNHNAILLNADVFKLRFEEQLIAQNPAIPNNLYGKLSLLSKELLAELKEAISDSYVMQEPLSDIQRDRITIHPLLIESFLANCPAYYGENKWNQRKDEILKPTNLASYKGYADYAKKLAERVSEFCHERLFDIIDGLIRNKNLKDLEIVPPTNNALLFAYPQSLTNPTAVLPLPAPITTLQEKNNYEFK